MPPSSLAIPDSPRLRLRLMDGGAGDAELLFDLDQDPEVMRFLNDGKPTPRKEIDEDVIPAVLAITDPAAGTGLWAVHTREDGEYLGWILVREYGFGTDYHERDNIELGWRLKRHCWGRGIATEAAQAVMDVLKANPAVRVFSAIADRDNRASTGVMEKLGMRFVDSRTHKMPKRVVAVDYYEMPAR